MNVKEMFVEVVKSILPITVVIVLMQFTLVKFPSDVFIGFLSGIVLTIFGFTLFMIGAKTSLLPIGETIGVALMNKAKLSFVIAFGVAIGFAVTIAEPSVHVLVDQIELVSSDLIARTLFIITISLGVGVFLGLSLLRVIFKFSFKKILVISYAIIFLLAALAPSEFFAISFDAGGVTTGTMTVPFIVALGIGMSSVRGTRQDSSDSFGFVGLASVGPIMALLLLGVIFG